MFASKSLLRQSVQVARSSAIARPTIASSARAFSSTSKVQHASPVEAESGKSTIKEFQIYRWVSKSETFWDGVSKGIRERWIA